LFIKGNRSKYVLDSDVGHILEVFPLASLTSMDTGHWVQAERPQEFVEVVTNYLDSL
jgi:pimeloyl-ACP methyl ester carboxylesterase